MSRGAVHQARQPRVSPSGRTLTARVVCALLAIGVAAPLHAEGPAPQGVGRQGAVREVLARAFPDRYRGSVPIFRPRLEGPVDVLRGVADGADAGAQAPLTCAVVGSSSNLLGAGYGREIDRHHVVIRINLAPVAGFKKDVGARTTHYVVNEAVRWSLREPEQTPGDAKDKWVPVSSRLQAHDPTAQWIPKRDDAGEGFGPGLPSHKVHPLNTDFYAYIKAAWIHPQPVRQEHHDEWRPSTGFTGVMVAAHACDQVDVYGFGADAKGQRAYYYKPGVFSAHKPSEEEYWLQELEKAGVLTLHLGNRKAARRR